MTGLILGLLPIVDAKGGGVAGHVVTGIAIWVGVTLVARLLIGASLKATRPPGGGN
jgi:hypothetical protein